MNGSILSIHAAFVYTYTTMPLQEMGGGEKEREMKRIEQSKQIRQLTMANTKE